MIRGHIVVKRADDDDVELLSGTLGEEHRAYFRECLKVQAGEVLAAWREGEPVAAVFLFWGEADETPVQAHLPGVPFFHHFQVSAPLRKLGIGTRLLLAGEDRLRSRGHRLVALGVDHGNKGAYRLYERLGYALPESDDLRGLPGPVPYDILVADLYRPLPADFAELFQQTSVSGAEVS